MTIGIYSLYWEEQDLIYIGQSNNIEMRYNSHLKSLNNKKHSNYKVQNAYNRYGTPALNILEVCLSKDLNIKENYWQKEFNSLDSLDIIKAGTQGKSGTEAFNSKYSRFTILKVFSYLYSKNELTQKEIANKCKVGRTTPNEIFLGRAHTWLNEEYPMQYKQMTDKVFSSNKGFDNVKPSMKETGREVRLYKDGVEYILDNQNQFAKEHGLDQSNLSKVILGKITQHKGFRLQI